MQLVAPVNLVKLTRKENGAVDKLQVALQLAPQLLTGAVHQTGRSVMCPKLKVCYTV